MTGTMVKDVHLAGAGLRLYVGQRVELTPATNMPDDVRAVCPWYARPADGHWRDGVERHPQYSILLDAGDATPDP